jgi:hypothetical protein
MSYKKNRQELIDEMREDAGFLYCQRCKQSSGFRNLHTHHIVFRSECNSRKVHEKRNLLICCDICHSLLHEKKELRNNLIKERGLQDLLTIQK